MGALLERIRPGWRVLHTDGTVVVRGKYARHGGSDWPVCAPPGSASGAV